MASTEYTAELDQINATVVGEIDRLRVLPQYCGARYMLVVENAVYDWMGMVCADYTGGQWDFYELSNGGFFMAMRGVESFDIEAPNYYSGKMSAEAAGITATLYALNEVACKTAQSHIVDLYYNLREYAVRHFESSEILRAID